MKELKQFAFAFFSPIIFLAYCYALHKGVMWVFDFATDSTGIGVTMVIVLVQTLVVYAIGSIGGEFHE